MSSMRILTRARPLFHSSLFSTSSTSSSTRTIFNPTTSNLNNLSSFNKTTKFRILNKLYLYSTMSDKKIVVVFGATGTQGGSVVDSLLNDPVTKEAFHIKGVTRDPTKPSAQALKDKGVEPIKADLDDIESLKAAFKGAWAVFAVTNYWDKMDKDLEFNQGKAIADCAKADNVSRLVWSSLINVNKETKGALPGVYHFDAKNDVEQYIRKLGIPATFFYPGFYSTNLFGGGTGIRKGENNEYSITLPTDADAPIPMFDPSDTGKYVKAILKRALSDPNALLGERVLSGQYVNAQDVIDIAAKELGGTGKWNTIPKDVFLSFFPAQMPDFAKEELAQNMQLLNKQYGYYGLGEDGKPTSLQPSLDILEEKPTSWLETVKNNKHKLA